MQQDFQNKIRDKDDDIDELIKRIRDLEDRVF